MARVPYDQGVPDALPRTQAPDDYQRIATSPAEFGGAVAQGAQKFGAGATTAAKFFGQVAADDAVNQFQKRIGDLVDGDPDKTVIGSDGQSQQDTGYMGSRGREALDKRPQVEAQIEDLRNEISSNLTTPDQRLLFDQYSRRYATLMMGRIGQHADREAGVFADAVNKAGTDLAGRSIMTNPDDDRAFAHAQGDMIGFAVKNLQAVGGANDNTLVSDAILNAKRQAAITRVEAWAPTQPSKALAFLKANSSLLTGPQYDTLTRRLQGASDHAEGAAAATAIWGGVPAPGARSAAGAAAPGDLWQRIKHQEGGVAPDGSALVSPKGAIGVSQILPATARTVAGELGLPYDEGRLHSDQAYNEQLGRRYLQDQLDRYGGNATLAAAAYNAGPDRVDQWIAQYGDPRRGAISDAAFAQHIPIPETRDYVEKVASAGAAATPGAAAAVAPDLAFGDSIAVQQIRHGVGGKEGARGGDQAGATAVIGDTPQQVLARINATDAGAFAGKTLFLSPGTSNDPSEVGLVAAEISALKAKGVRSIVIPGVGPGVPHQAAVNAQLANIAQAAGAGVVFFQPDIRWQADGIHPAEVDRVRQQAAVALARQGAPAAAAAAPGLGAAQHFAPPDIGHLVDAVNDRVASGALTPAAGQIAVSQLTRSYNHWHQATAAARATMVHRLNDGAAALADGNRFDYDPTEIRALFLPDQAQHYLDALDEAHDQGEAITAVKGMAPADIAAKRAELAAGLAQPDAPDYLRRRRYLAAFDAAAQRQAKQLADDPAGWVATLPDVHAQALAVDAQRPATFAAYATASLAAQDRLGVPAAAQHVLSTAQVPGLVAAIAADPEQAPARMQAMAAQYGAAWPMVWRDLTTLGKLPAAYQAVGTLDNERDAALLARALGQTQKSGKEWGDIIGPQPVANIKKSVRADPGVQQLTQSLARSGSSLGQIGGVMSAIDTLAFAKSYYDHDPNAAQDAVDSFIGKYEFMPNGGARVPKAVFDAVSANAAATLSGLAPGGIALPAIFTPPAVPATAAGRIVAGNLDLQHLARPRDGSAAPPLTIDIDGNQVLIPTAAADGSGHLDAAAAIAQYHRTGHMLGIFDTAAHAAAYGEQVQRYQAALLAHGAMPGGQDYVDLVKTAPTWITAPTANALWLMDPQGRVVRGTDGKPIAVPFAAPAPAAAYAGGTAGVPDPAAAMLGQP